MKETLCSIPVEITEDPQFVIFRDDQRLNDSFGLLKFDGTQKYYALDGQHRLSAIKTLLDRTNPLSDGSPENFENDEFSVIVVVPSPSDSNENIQCKNTGDYSQTSTAMLRKQIMLRIL